MLFLVWFLLQLAVYMQTDFPIDVGLSSDFISGFCGETEEEHKDTISLLREVRYTHYLNILLQ